MTAIATITTIGAKRLRTKHAKLVAMLVDRGTTAGEKANAQSLIERTEAQLAANGYDLLADRNDPKERIRVEVTEANIAVRRGDEWLDPRDPRDPGTPDDTWRRCKAVITTREKRAHFTDRWDTGQRQYRYSTEHVTAEVCNRLFDPLVSLRTHKRRTTGSRFEREFCSAWCKDRDRRSKEAAVKATGGPGPKANIPEVLTKREVLQAFAAGAQAVLITQRHYQELQHAPGNDDFMELPLRYDDFEAVTGGRAVNLDQLAEAIAASARYQERLRVVQELATEALATYVPEYPNAADLLTAGGAHLLTDGQGVGGRATATMRKDANRKAALDFIRHDITSDETGAKGLLTVHSDIPVTGQENE